MKEESKWKCNVVEVDVNVLKLAQYNPRQANKEDYNNLKSSIERFGIVDPLIVNNAENRKNVVVGGHFRLKVIRDLKVKKVPVVYVNIPDIEKEKELNLRLNKNLGSWDVDLLGNFNDELLKMVGFGTGELEEIFDLKEKEEKPEVEFTEELLLEHNYVVLYFDNAFDWQVATEKFGLKDVKDLIPRKGQPTGIGRVVNGKKWLDKIKG